MSVDEALEHKFLADFRVPDDEPVAEHLFDLDDNEPITVNVLDREQINKWRREYFVFTKT